MDGLSRKIQEVKDFVDERVEALSRKQDSLGDSQDAMKGQLDDVQDGVQQVTLTAVSAVAQIGAQLWECMRSLAT